MRYVEHVSKTDLAMFYGVVPVKYHGLLVLHCGDGEEMAFNLGKKNTFAMA